MKILVAPNPFKNCLPAQEIASLIAEGLMRVWPDASCIQLPIADGGDGMLEAMLSACGGKLETASVADPLGRSIEARFALLADGSTAVIEMAEASGLRLLSTQERNPLRTTSYGTGQLIARAIGLGCKRIILGLGGSATVDGGMGAAQALGAVFYDRANAPLPQMAGGGHLSVVARADLSVFWRKTQGVSIILATDVENTLCGAQGAAAIYGPQKGASPDDVRQLDAGLHRYAGVLQDGTGMNVLPLLGGGAAGGIAAGMAALCKASMQPGIKLVMDAAHFEEQLIGCDLVVTAEGQVDGQTLQGKAPAGIAEMAQKHHVPVLIIGGSLASDAHALLAPGRAIMSAIPSPVTLAEALAEVRTFLPDAAERAGRLIKIGMEMPR